MTATPLPPVLRSWQHLRDTRPDIAAPAALPITPGGTTFVMAQELSFLDLQHFAVGRWDGSMSIFSFSESTTQGPVISKAVNSPAAEGVQMIAWLASGVIATSNDSQSVTIWQSASGTWSDLAVWQTLTYDASYDVANSADSLVTPSGVLYLFVGHASGFATIWTGNADGSNLTFTTAVDLRSAKPVNPWGIHNIRGASWFEWDGQYAYFVTGSEDGDLCVVRVPDGTILSRTVYNPSAQRGINSIASLGGLLLVANCSVGPNDKNLWYYSIDSSTWAITLLDSMNLQVDSTLQQVFNFDVIWAIGTTGIYWFAATEEGYLWMGIVNNSGQLGLIGNQQVTGKLGAALGYSLAGNLAVVAYDLYEFTIANTPPAPDGHPSRITATAQP